MIFHISRFALGNFGCMNSNPGCKVTYASVVYVSVFLHLCCIQHLSALGTRCAHPSGKCTKDQEEQKIECMTRIGSSTCRLRNGEDKVVRWREGRQASEKEVFTADREFPTERKSGPTSGLNMTHGAAWRREVTLTFRRQTPAQSKVPLRSCESVTGCRESCALRNSGVFLSALLIQFRKKTLALILYGLQFGYFFYCCWFIS